MNTLVVTNDFPPRPGGIQQYVLGYASRLPAHDLSVFTSAWRGDREFDARLGFPVERAPTKVLLPRPSATKRVAALVRERGIDTVWFGASAPLGLMAPALRKAGVRTIVASTHGHEVGWAATPGARSLLRRIGNHADVITYLGDYTRSRLEPAFGRHPSYLRLPGGVDVSKFHPGVDGTAVRAKHGIPPDVPVVVCVSRLVPRKGQAALIRGLAGWRSVVPGCRLLLVGGGPDRESMRKLARHHGVAGAVTITGSVAAEELPAHYAAGNVFAMSCSTRKRGLEVEGLGMVFLEAAACGLPVVVGKSGGSVDALRNGETGILVDGKDDGDVHAAVASLLADPAHARGMGAAGRAFVTREFSWDVLAPRLAALLTR